jgi:outer membrane protein OmpA-like peptidoglycan-associated protein
MKKILIIAIAGLISVFASAQTKKADSLFAKWNYFKAAQLYAKTADKKPSQDIYFHLGQCYQKMCRYKEAVAAYDKANAFGHNANAAFYLNYGLMLKTSERYADAKVAFSMYSSMMPSDAKGQFYLSSCDVVTDDKKNELPITIKAVSALNSNAADLCPVIYKDGIVFISSRKADGHGSKIYGWDGENYLDIFYAKKGGNDTNFGKAAPIEGKPINKKYHNGPVCFSKNFDTIYFDRVSKELRGKEKKTLNIETIKIYSAVYKDGKWSDLKPFQCNNDTFSVATPYLTRDGSKIYFSSNRPGGYGGDDIYYCTRQGTGWSKPINMGPNINTFGDEKFPAMDSNGDFYFSSDGYKGYGGMDICVSKNTNGTYGQASVMKAPFNSADNDYGITFTKSGRIGYLSSNRNTGTGDEKIYHFDLDQDNLDCPAVTSAYVIGYNCPAKAKPIVVLNDTTTPTPVLSKLPDDRYSVRSEKAIMPIHFDYDKAIIRNDAAKTLDSIVLILRRNPKLSLNVNGYCDARGTLPYNQILSNQRSVAAVNYIISKGIDKKRMFPKGYGKTNFVNRCLDGVSCSDNEQEQNRRVEMLFMNNKSKLIATGNN